MTKTADVTAPAAAVAAPWATPAANAAPSPESAAPASPAADTVVTETPPAEPAVKVAAEAVDMVTVTVPRAFKLMLDYSHTKEFKAGIQEMERPHAEHWYSKACGVEIYSPKAPAAE